VKDIHNLDLELSVNGTVKQKGNTSMMIFRMDELIAYVSRFMTIEKGDIMATGTPEGIGPPVKGDTVVAGMNGVGELKNKAVRSAGRKAGAGRARTGYTFKRIADPDSFRSSYRLFN